MELDNHFKDQNVDEDLDEKEPIKSIVHINHLPQVVFEYILSHLSPYKDLSYCKLVSKSWDVYVKCKLVYVNFLFQLKYYDLFSNDREAQA